MKYLFSLVIIFFTLMFVLSGQVSAKTVQKILKDEGYSLLSKVNGKEVYYRPKEVKRIDGIVYYSTTVFTTSNGKYSLRSEYKVLACKEKRVLIGGEHLVPFIGKSSYKDFTKKGIKDSDFKTLTALDKIISNKFCK